MIRFLIAVLALTFFVPDAAVAQTPSAPASTTYGFLTHAAFFSVEVMPADLVDPQVFVADRRSGAATGPQGIAHLAGYRPALGVDDPSNALSNALGKPLGFTLASWFTARGTVVLAPSGNDTRATLAFSGLVPAGRYSMFENHFSPAGVTFTPLDGTGTTNSFSAAADGSAQLALTIPGRVRHSEGILLVYHSDGVDH
nr:hypothetical protein [Candidatus Eremiobacteraeota bacterium]